MRPASSSIRGLLAAAVVLAVILGGVGGYLIGLVSPVAGEAMPSDTSAEAGFSRDMQVHHLQGAELALIAHERSTDPEIEAISRDILLTQQQQAGQMFGWLSVWGLAPAASEPSMTWMTRPALPTATDDDHGSMGGSGGDSAVPALMPGMATSDQIAQLRAASGVAEDRLFLQLMIAHHEGAIEMAEALLARSTNGVVTDFADRLIVAQTAEISQMQAMLEARPAA
ncbi:DUF305 domain-containing protein [Microbacteriaceae bacterium VKM Ac-2855]|nr:DUF305 domain-containing protein [Microbacteriaceae bacterium VKM Ac-2855]